VAGGAIEPATPATLAAHVESKARTLAHVDYTPPDTVLPGALAGLDYEQYRSIRFRPDAALWRGETPFEVQLFHPGFIFRKSVRINLVDDERVVGFPFDTDLFLYDGPAAHLADAVAPDLGYAGFRVHYPLNDPGVQDEVVVFQGASYFRLVGPGQVYGLSSRGLAVDIARDSGEEFPDFREFWLVRPAPEASTLVFYALLDSPSVTGAYRFELEPGTRTVLSVDAHIFARRDVRALGVAPLSSMFLYDANLSASFDDFRPEVHDSDGLMALTGKGEWIWRPLGNNRGLRVTSLRDRDPQGFGLAQRERDFDNYLDLEAQYHRRPSEWVLVEDGDWGSGGVELLEIPTQSEFNDNVAAYWVPDEPFLAGEERHYRYKLITFDGRLGSQALAQVERTRVGWDALPGQADPPPRSQRRFIVDFSGGALDSVEAGRHVEALIEASSGQITDLRSQPLPSGLGWRVSFRLDPDGDRPTDMRLYLELEDERLSETWTYVWYPEQVR
jgi:glucans biosynthesis protein